MDFAFLKASVNGIPLEATPFLPLIIVTQDGDDEVGFIKIELLEMER